MVQLIVLHNFIGDNRKESVDTRLLIEIIRPPTFSPPFTAYHHHFVPTLHSWWRIKLQIQVIVAPSFVKHNFRKLLTSTAVN